MKRDGKYERGLLRLWTGNIPRPMYSLISSGFHTGPCSGRKMALQLGGMDSISRLIQRIEKSEVPLGEEEEKFETIKEKYARRAALTSEERDLVLKLAKKAEEWEKAVESSAFTEPGQTLPGC